MLTTLTSITQLTSAKELMNLSHEPQADPYLDIDRYPRSLVLLLLRAKIAVEYPRDAKKIRLINFFADFNGDSTTT